MSALPTYSLNVAHWDDEQHLQLAADCLPFMPSDQGYDSQLRIEEAGVETELPSVRLQNLGETCELLWHGQQLGKGEAGVFSLPIHIIQEGHHLELRQHGQLNSLNRPFHTIERPRSDTGEPMVPIERLGTAPSAETMARWFATLELLQHSTGGSQQYFASVAQAATNPGGMTAGFVILRDGDGWTTVGSHIPDPTLGISYCYDLLERVIGDGRTHYHDALEDAEDLPDGADSVVAAPILSNAGEVKGVVYGYRSLRNRNKRRSIRAMEALWIQMLAGSVSAALSRMAAEAEAARKTVLLEHAFSPKVMREITENPAALAGQERTTTILFADLRESTSISESLSAKENYDLLSDLLDRLSLQVRNFDGVIIDYYGDGMAAMWNAPTDQPDHANLACQAALAMQEQVAELNEKWEGRIGRRIRIGIGINTGQARVGNAGSKTRLKYGPRGTAVNVASRLETATKHLVRPILVTKSVVNELGPGAIVSRVCKLRLAGISDPIDAFELHTLERRSAERMVLDQIGQYELALEHFERGDLDKAEHVLDLIAKASQQVGSDRFLRDAIQVRRNKSRQLQSEPDVIDISAGGLNADASHPAHSQLGPFAALEDVTS